MSDFTFQDEDARWWTKSSGGLHESIFALVDRIEDDQSDRLQSLKDYQRLYEDRGDALGAKNKSRHRVTYNVVKSCIDTAAAKISKNRPRPLFLTSGGDFKLQRKAEKLTKFMDAIFSEMRVYEAGQLVFRDCEMFDGGALRLYVEGDRIGCERAMVNEIFVDRHDAYYGKPRQLHQKRRVSRDVLADLFPHKRFDIKTCPPAETDSWGSAIAPSMVELIESWHLPSGPGADDGRHVISIENATLLDEGYEKDDFPFVFLFWNQPVCGFWSPGLAEELRGIQTEINKLLEDIRVAQKRLGRPYVAIERGSDINKAHINNEIGAIIEYSGQPPQFGLSSAMPGEVYAHLERLKNAAYEITGISQMSARSEKPAGLDSGKALREFQDIESERFVLVGQRYEQFFLEIARKVIDLARDLYADGVNLLVKARAGKFLESINWSDVDLEDDQYEMQVFPVSILPTTPAGRYEMITDLARNALITPQQAKKLMTFPDIEDEMSLENASIDALRMILDRMADGGDYEPPEPFYDLETAKRLGLMTYLRMKVQAADEVDLEKIRTWLDDIENLTAMAMAGGPAELMGQATEPAIPPGTPPAMGPMGTLEQFGAPPLPPEPMAGFNPAMLAA